MRHILCLSEGEARKRRDGFLTYENGALGLELQGDDEGDTWNTYDGEDELIMQGYAGARAYFDVVGDTVYKVLKTGSTTDVSYVAEMEGKRVVARSDLTHGGRQYYWVMSLRLFGTA